MTGFGVGDALLGGGRLVAEVRSVNGRFLDVRAKLPRDLADFGLFAEQVLRAGLRRGRVELVVRVEGPVFSAFSLDRQRLRSAFSALRELRDELDPGAELPLSVLAAVPDLFAPAVEDPDEVRAALERAISAALSAMGAMCEAEGRVLAKDALTRVERVREAVREIGERALGARDATRARLEERLGRLLEGRDARLDPGRLEAEVALLVDRSDVAEELTRLRCHLDHFAAALEARGEPVGRKLEFLLQELVREANTLGSKAQDAAVSALVVDVKVELERLREQVQNVE